MDLAFVNIQSGLFTALSIAAVSGLLFFTYQAALPKPIAGIPYDEKAARNIFGSLPDMISHLRTHGVVIPWLTHHNAKHNAPLVQFFGLPFSKPTIVLSDYQESQDVLIRRTKDFDRSSQSLDSLKGAIPYHHIAMRSADSRFKGNKELVRDLMSPNFLAEVSAAQIYSKSLALIDLWSFKAKTAGGRPFEARHDIFDAGLDMVNAAAFAFGDDLSIIHRQLDHFVLEGDVDSHEASNGSFEFSRLPFVPEITALTTVSEFLGAQIVSPKPFVTYHYKMITDAKLRRAVVDKDNLIKSLLKESFERLEAGDETQRSAVDFLIQREYSVARKERREPDIFSRRNIDELFGYIVAGHETSSSTLSWALKLISDNQDVQKKVCNNLEKLFTAAKLEARQPTAKEIVDTSNPYLDAVIEEVLRSGQPTPMVAREAMVDTILLGHMIPKGSTLLVNSSGPGYHSQPLHVDDSRRSDTSRTKYYGGVWNLEGMDDFNPDRWLKKDGAGEVIYDPQAGPILAFGMGPRGCFGKKLAYLEMRMVLTLLLWNFQFRKLEGEMASYDTLESVTVMPKFCYVGIDQIQLGRS